MVGADVATSKSTGHLGALLWGAFARSSIPLSLSVTFLLINLVGIISHFLEPPSYPANYFQLSFPIADNGLLNYYSQLSFRIVSIVIQKS